MPQHLGDMVIPHGQRLPLRLEPGDDLFAVHPEFDELEGDPSLDRLGLFGDIDYAAAAFTELLPQFVAANRLTDGTVRKLIVGGLRGRELGRYQAIQGLLCGGW